MSFNPHEPTKLTMNDEIELRKYSVEIAMKSNSICDPAECAETNQTNFIPFA